jgi:uncharacterized membrane protein
MDPRISALRRILMGFVTGLAAFYLRNIIKNNIVYFVVIAILGTCLNTFFVLSAITIFGVALLGQMGGADALKWILSIALSVNCLVEVIAAVIVVPSVCTTLLRVVKLKYI